MTPVYEVVVGNIGTVYRGESVLDSMAVYLEYERQSRDPDSGRAAGETVTIFKDGEIISELQKED